MSEEARETPTGERSLNTPAPPQSQENHLSYIRESVEGVKASVEEGLLEERMGELRDSVGAVTQEAREWISKQRESHLRNLEDLQQQVVALQDEWGTWSDRLKSGLGRIESLLHTFPGVVEVSILRTLSLRVGELEHLVSNHIAEERARVGIERSRKQLIVSLAALGITVVLWLVFIVLQFIR